MSRTRTLQDLITDVRSRTNMETSSFITDLEITEFLNQELAELWSHLAQGSGAPPYRGQYPIAVTAGTALYGLPADFYQCQGVEAVVDGITYALRNFMPRERARLANQGRHQSSIQYRVQYRIQGDNIEFQPATEAFPATLFYTPTCPRLSALTDTFDGFNGYEIAAIYGACAAVQQKEESDPSFYEGRKQRLYREIEAMAVQRDAAEPERVQNVIGGLDDDGGCW